MTKEHQNKIMEILEKYEEVLNSNDFSTLYEKIPNYLVPDTTLLLLSAGINILANIDYVPIYYLYDVRSPQEEITIPGNITAIGREAFSQCTGLKKTNINVYDYMEILRVLKYSVLATKSAIF